MECDRNVVGRIRTAIEVRSYIAEAERLGGDAMTLAMGIASVLADDPFEDGDDVGGVSWLDEEKRPNALFVASDSRVHAMLTEGSVEATNYSSGIDTLRASEIKQQGQLVDDGWRVHQWHLTLRDGSVITLRASNGQHSDEVAEFVRKYLVPSRSL
jgi:hypothetical protein